MFPNISKPFTLTTDASDQAVVAVKETEEKTDQIPTSPYHLITPKKNMPLMNRGNVGNSMESM